MTALRWLWAPAHYWPIWLGATLGVFLVRELWALISRHPWDTFSDWVWAHLRIVAHESIGQWSAATLLIFLTYISVFVLWLPWHLFFRRFT